MENLTLTENGDVAFSTTGDCNLDFFTRIVRGATTEDVVSAFVSAWEEDAVLAMRVLMNLRDARNGKQEKLIPVIVMVYLKHSLPARTYEVILREMLKYGYWKDLLKIHEISTKLAAQTPQPDIKMSKSQKALMSKLTTYAVAPIEIVMFAEQLTKDYNDYKEGKCISLCGKWCPSEKSHYDKSCQVVKSLKTLLSMTSKEYRVMLSELRKHLKVLEMYMATKQYDLIDFSSIPATAMKKMNKAFTRDTNADGVESKERVRLHLSYLQFMEKVTKGEEKVNVTGIQPNDIVKHYMGGGEYNVLIEEQWKALLTKVQSKGTFNKVTAIVDVSGSMEGEPMQVAIALGIMVASSTSGRFANQVITFHETPTWYNVTGDNLQEKVRTLMNCPWGGSTNLRKVFDLILGEALRYNLTPDQMVDTLYIFTDMQFDQAMNSNDSTFQDAKNAFESNGYALPKIIFWNLRSSESKAIPVEKDENNVALLSGFSSELLNCILDAEEFTPMKIMMHVLEPYPLLNVSNIPLKTPTFDMGTLESTITSCQIKNAFKAQ